MQSGGTCLSASDVKICSRLVHLLEFRLSPGSTLDVNRTITEMGSGKRSTMLGVI